MQQRDVKKALTKRLELGPASGGELAGSAGISQASFSRLIRTMKDVLITGRARKTRYVLKRHIQGIGTCFPVFEIDEKGVAIQLGTLHSFFPKGFFWESAFLDEARFFDDLPYFLNDLRPSGFLGRLVPSLHPELGFPTDIRNWSSDQVLRYLTTYGWNLIGNLIPGDSAFQTYLDETTKERPAQSKIYPELARDVLQLGDTGSSAAGEQPKFVINRTSDHFPVLVKFSPPLEDRVSQRRADLLICEHLAHRILSENGQNTAKSEIILDGNRVFLEMKRFDRTSSRGRRGVISLEALDLEFVGSGGRWTTISAALVGHSIIDANLHEKIQWLELFGNLIGNTDMHSSNLSFYCEHLRVIDLAPVYDMLPMLYAPQSEQIIVRNLTLNAPKPSDASIWDSAWLSAKRFWETAASDQRISQEFRQIAHVNLSKVEALGRVGALLPKKQR